MVIVYIGTGYMQVLYLGRAPRTKETVPDFHEWRQVTRHPLVFHGLTGSQRTPGNLGCHRLAHGASAAQFRRAQLLRKGHIAAMPV